MKKINYKKLAKKIHDEMRTHDLRPVKEAVYDTDWSEYDKDISDKFKKMVLNLAAYKNNININVDTNRVSISTYDITSIKKPKNKTSLHSDDNFVEMAIYKDLGFSICIGYSLKSNYKDKELYDEILPILTNKLKEINADNFNNIWKELMTGSGLLRDNNLDEIFGNG